MSRNNKPPPDPATMDSAVQFVLTNVPRSQLLEMYYWTQEQDILRIVRGLVALPEQTRHELMLFLDQLQHRRAQAQQPEDDEPLVDDEDEEAKPYNLPH